MMDKLNILINGSSRNLNLRPGTLTFSRAIQEQMTLECELLSTNETYRPVLGDRIVLTKDARLVSVQTYNNSPALTFTPGMLTREEDVGNVIVISNGMGMGVPLVSRIIDVTSDTTATMEFNAMASLAVGTLIGEWLWGGFITDLTESPFYADVGRVFKVSAQDYNAFVNRILINTWFGDTLSVRDAMTVVTNTLNYAFGTRQDPMMATGPQLGSIWSFPWTPCMEVVDKLVQKAQWTWQITPDNVFRAFPPGDYVLPTLDVDDPLEGTLEISSNFDDYRNDEHVFFGGSGEGTFKDMQPGDGVRRAFDLLGWPINYHIEEKAGQIFEWRNHGTTVVELEIGPLGSGKDWEYNPGSNQVIQNASREILGVNDAFWLEYTANFPLMVGSGNTDGVAKYGFFSKVDTYDQSRERNAAQAYADELINQFGREPLRTIVLTTYHDLYARVGARVPVYLPKRDIVNVNYIVQTATATDDGYFTLQYAITLVRGDHYRDMWLDFWREMEPERDTESSSSGAAAPESPGGGPVGGTGSTGGAEPGPPKAYPGTSIHLGGDNYNVYTAIPTLRDIPQAIPGKLGGTPMAGVWTFRAFGFLITPGNLEVTLMDHTTQVPLGTVSLSHVAPALSADYEMGEVKVTCPGTVHDILCKYRVLAGAVDVVIGHCTLTKD